MVIHRIRAHYSVNGADAFHQWLVDWNSSQDHETDDSVVNAKPDAPIETENGEKYYQVSLSFNWTDGQFDVLEEPYLKLAELTDWSRVVHHRCEHDEPDGSGCKWETKLEPDDCTVPEYVDTFPNVECTSVANVPDLYTTDM